ncbi:MAG TPA: methyl-accepting chemotaxis protein [Chloroflexota bacterium]|nr:methyl-accepting chemotaxis protein [Chloroflexota bacterium]
MSPSTLRSTILGVAVVAAVLDVAIVVLALLAQPALSVLAILAIIAALVALIGGFQASHSAGRMLRDSGEDLAANKAQLRTVSQKLNEVAEYLGHVEVNKASDDSVEALNIASMTVDAVAGGSASQLEKTEQASRLASRIAETINVLDKATADNIAATEQTIRAVVEVSRALEDTATNAQKVAAASEEAAALAQQGEDAVRRTIQSINVIKDTVLSSADKVQKLDERSRQIGNIVQVIDDIADQTNLLALNAAIEAARAGEQGKGFAVVASEVRKLAERTSRATKEIGELIMTTQDETAAAVQAMHVGSQEVEEGSNLGSDAGNALQQILESVARNNEQVQNISAAVEEMTASSNEIVNAVESFGDKAKANTSVTRDLLGDIEKLAAMVEAVATISRDNAAATEQLANMLQQRPHAANSGSNGGLSQIASQLKLLARV